MAKRERVDFAPELERLGVEADAGDAFIPGAPRQGGAVNAGAPALRLAQSLAGLSGSLQGFVNANAREADRQTGENRSRFKREEQERGRRAASTAAAAAGRAVIDGIIPPGASPYFIMGVKQQQGRLIAKDHQSGLMEHLLTVDPVTGNVGKSISEFNKVFNESNGILADPQVGVGFSSIAQGTESNARANFFARKNAAMRQQMADQTGTETADAMEGLYTRAVVMNQAPDYKVLGASIVTDLARDATFQGLGRFQTIKSIAEAVIRHAEDFNSTSALKALDSPYEDPHSPGTMLPPISKNPRIADMIAIAEDKIDRERRAMESESRRVRADNRTEATNAYSNWLYAKLKADRTDFPTPAEMAGWASKGVSDVGMKAERVIGAISDETPSSSKMLGTVKMMVMTGEIASQEELFDAITGIESDIYGRIKINFEEYEKFSSLIRSVQTDGSVLKDPQYTAGVRDLFFDLKVDKNNMTGEPLYDIDGSATRNFKLFRGDIRREYAIAYASAVDGKPGLSSVDKSQIAGSITKELKEKYFPKIYTQAAEKLIEQIEFGLDELSLEELNNMKSEAHARLFLSLFPRGHKGANEQRIYQGYVARARSKKILNTAAKPKATPKGPLDSEKSESFGLGIQ